MGNLAEFDTTNVVATRGFEAIPKGKYLCVVLASEIKKTKAGDGLYLNIQLQIIDGQFENRRLFSRMNIRNPSEVAQQIGLGQLKALKEACGKPNEGDSDNLHNIAILVDVGIRKNKETNEYENEVKTFYPRTTDAQLAATPIQQAVNGAAVPPWHKK